MKRRDGNTADVRRQVGYVSGAGHGYLTLLLLLGTQQHGFIRIAKMCPSYLDA